MCPLWTQIHTHTLIHLCWVWQNVGGGKTKSGGGFGPCLYIHRVFCHRGKHCCKKFRRSERTHTLPNTCVITFAITKRVFCCVSVSVFLNWRWQFQTDYFIEELRDRPADRHYFHVKNSKTAYKHIEEILEIFRYPNSEAMQDRMVIRGELFQNKEWRFNTNPWEGMSK